MFDRIVEAGPLAGVRSAGVGETPRATAAALARVPSWSRTSRRNTRLWSTGTRSPVVSWGVIDRNWIPVANTVTMAVRESDGTSGSGDLAITRISTSGFAGTKFGGSYVEIREIGRAHV